MAELIGRLRRGHGPRPGGYSDLGYALGAGGAPRSSLAAALMVSIQAGLRARARGAAWSRSTSTTARWGSTALFALWFLAPLLRRVLALQHRLREQRPALAGPLPRHRRPGGARAAPGATFPTRDPARAAARRGRASRSGCRSASWPARRAAALRVHRLHRRISAARCSGSRERSRCSGSTLRRVLLYRHAGDRGLRDRPARDHPAQLGLRVARVDRLRQRRRSEARRGARVLVPQRPRALAPLLGLSLLCYLTRPARPAARVRRAWCSCAGAVHDLRALGLGGADRGRDRPRGGLATAAAPGWCSARWR